MLNTAPGRTPPRPAGPRFGAVPAADAPCGSLPERIAACAALHGAAPALAGSGEALSYAELGAAQARYARWARAEGYGPGTTAALLMADRPGRHALWLGLARAGLRVALLDPAARGWPLARCLALAAPALLVVDPALAEAVAARPAALPPGTAVRWHGPGADLARLDLEAAEHGGEPLGEAEMASPDGAALLAFTADPSGRWAGAEASHGQLAAWTEGAAPCPPAFRALVEIGARLLAGPAERSACGLT